MKIPSWMLPVLNDTLEHSVAEGRERLGLLDYNQRTGIVTVIVPAELLKQSGVTHSSTQECLLDDRVLEDIRQFNLGQIDTVHIGSVTLRDTSRYQTKPGESKIVPYHTHPLEDMDIFPSKEDLAYMARMGAPAVVVGSKKARDQHKLKPPFVVAYGNGNGKGQTYTIKPLDDLLPFERELALGEYTTNSPMEILVIK